MNTRSFRFLVGAALITVAAAMPLATAQADRGGGHWHHHGWHGHYWGGGPYWRPYAYMPRPYYYAPPRPYYYAPPPVYYPPVYYYGYGW